MRLPVSRRAVLSGLASLAASPARAANPDVLIIGAGAAGLAAGHELKRRKISFQIAEARGRPGGRMFTDTSLGLPFDAGAFYIHWAEKNPWTPIARAEGVPIAEDPMEIGQSQAFANGERLPPGAAGVGSNRVTELLERVPKSRDRSFAEAAAGEPEEVRLRAAMLARTAFGEEPERISAVDYQSLEAGSDLGLPDGYGALAARYAASLPIAYNTPVTGLNWQGRGIAAVTLSGTIKARAAIVTIPAAVIAADRVAFAPALPTGLSQAFHDIGAGASTRAALKFDGARLGASPFTRYADITNPAERMSFTLWPYDRDIVTAWFGGDYARSLAKLGEADALQIILERFVRIAGPDARKAFVQGRVHFWQSDPFALGAYSLTRPGKSGARKIIAEPLAGKLWFAGEAASPRGALTAGGAYLSGQAAARQAAAALRR